jgi:hypothetical protein
MAGYPDGTFRPWADITRAEAVTAVNRLLGRGYAERPDWVAFPFTDVRPAYWAYDSILEASVAHGYTSTAEGEIWLR